MTGPIDDAFTNSFLCVHGTGKPWHEATQKYADENPRAAFQAEWSKYLRGTLPIKDDSDVNADDIAGRNLILFGDPSSNSADRADSRRPAAGMDQRDYKITLAGKTVSAADHVPVLIHPNPLNARPLCRAELGSHIPRGRLPEHQCATLSARGDYALLEAGCSGKGSARRAGSEGGGGVV